MNNRQLDPLEEMEQMIREATQSVEDELSLEDEGWIKLGSIQEVISPTQRVENVKASRIYWTKDPLAKQSVRLWTDYTFGTGTTWQSDDDVISAAMDNFWGTRANKSILSPRGQRKSSDKLLVDGEIFFALFLGTKGEATIRRVDPLEITEIITDPDDIENVLYYKREWVNQQSQPMVSYYRSWMNIDGEPAKDSLGVVRTQVGEAIIYHLAINTLGQRGNPMLLPALDWIKQYRRFLASRVGIMLALARFAWKTKLMGGTTAVNAAKSKYDEAEISAGSMLIENMGSDTQPIRTDSNARNAYEDGRMLKLQVAAATGIPEQYYGDISIGNLATAKTVELPMMKMFQSYQAIWRSAFDDINEIVFEHAGVPENKRYVDLDFPAIAPEDVVATAAALSQILMELPQLGDSRDVQQVALMALGINNTNAVLDALATEAKKNGHGDVTKLVKALREYRVSLEAVNG